MNGPPWIHCMTGAGRVAGRGAEPAVHVHAAGRLDVQLDELPGSGGTGAGVGSTLGRPGP